MNIIFAGKYCKNLNIEKFKKYKYKFIEEFEDYKKYLHEADYIISYGYGKIFKNDALKKKIFNLHPSILPYGRGIYPIVWSIYNKNPIGYTIYQINTNRIDEGFIYSQKEIAYDENNTFKELFLKITNAVEYDFCENFENYFLNDSSIEIKDDNNQHYKSKKESKIILNFLKDGWNTKIKDFLFFSKNI